VRRVGNLFRFDRRSRFIWDKLHPDRTLCSPNDQALALHLRHRRQQQDKVVRQGRSRLGLKPSASARNIGHYARSKLSTVGLSYSRDEKHAAPLASSLVLHSSSICVANFPAANASTDRRHLLARFSTSVGINEERVTCL